MKHLACSDTAGYFGKFWKAEQPVHRIGKGEIVFASHSGALHFWSKLGKAVAAAATAVGLVFSLSACGASSAGKQTLYFWNSLVGDDGPMMQKIVNSYNATNSKYRVVFQPMNGGDELTKIYSVMQTGKNIPDIVEEDQFVTAQLESQGLLNTSDAWVKYQPDLNEKSYLPQAWQGTVVNGKSYGIPLYMFQMALYYNKNLVKKYHLQYIIKDGWVTTDEIKSMKGKLPKGVYALASGNIPWAIMSMLYSGGGSVEEGVKDMRQPMWRNPLKALREINDMGLMDPIDQDGEQVFGSQHAVFGMLGTWAQGNMSKTLGANNIGEINTLQYTMKRPSNFLFQQNMVQLKDPNRSEERSRAAADFVEYVHKHWMMWSSVGSISPAYRDLNNPEYRKLIQASFTNTEKQRKAIRTSNYVYGGYATAGWGTYNDIVYSNVTLDEGLNELNFATQGQIQIQQQS
jgi:multiple sugar transport system substrate-binding protein